MSSYRLKADGSGAAGYVRGDAHVALTPQGEGATLMTISGDADVGGPVARVGQRLLEIVTRGMMKEFFTRVEQQL
jgi:carbon monoxide dehydrogenase subunit G